jgi:hypothetical protein
MDNKEPRLPSQSLMDVLKSAVHVRGHFRTWLSAFFKDSISIEAFEQLHESIKIGILYNYITKIGININVYPLIYDIYFINYTPKQLEDIEQMEHLEILHKDIINKDILVYYIEFKKRYEGNIMQGLKFAIIDTITFLNNSQWLKISN